MCFIRGLMSQADLVIVFIFCSIECVIMWAIVYFEMLQNRKGLYISDVPIHDATRDLVLLSEKFEAEYKLTRNLEILTDKLQQTYRELESEKQKTDRWVRFVCFFKFKISCNNNDNFSFKRNNYFDFRLLYSVLPITVANELRHQRPVAPKR